MKELRIPVQWLASFECEEEGKLSSDSKVER
jgi:hypothetical protein